LLFNELRETEASILVYVGSSGFQSNRSETVFGDAASDGSGPTKSYLMLLRYRRLVEVSLRLVLFATQLLINFVLRRGGPASSGVLARKHLLALGGGYIKLAETLALRYDVFPPKFCKQLDQSRDAVPRENWPVRETIERELGLTTDQLFSCFEEAPFKTGYFEQRHYAVLQTGEPVIVKVLKTGPRRIAEADLLGISVVLKIIDFSGLLGRVRLSTDYHRFSTWMLQSLSLLNEARLAERLAAESDDDPTHYVPLVYWPYTTESVLILERVEGVMVSEVMDAIAHSHDRPAVIGQLEAKGLNLREAAGNIAHCTFSQLLDAKHFNRDPRPADLIIMEDNVISYSDFSTLGRIEHRFSRYRFDFLCAARTGDIDSLFEVLLEYLEPPFDANLAALEERFKSHVSEWVDNCDDESSSQQERSLLTLIAGCLDSFRRFQIPLSVTALAYCNAIVAVERIVATIAHDLDFQEEWKRFFREVLNNRIRRQLTFDGISGVFLEYEALALNFPQQFRESLRLLRRDHYSAVRTVNRGDLGGWKLMHSLATMLILAFLIARVWAFFYPLSWPRTAEVLLSPAAFVALLAGLMVLRRVFKLRYEYAARGEYRVRLPG
jgi:ubiquinone biosynthesis protein